MKRLLKKISRLDGLLEETNQYIKSIQENTYYTTFASMTEQVRDLSIARNQRKRLLNMKHCALESLQQKAEVEKANISYAQRELTTI